MKILNQNKIIGIGIDSIKVNRFENWINYSKQKLEKIFSKEEINYCLQANKKSAERFAARFAAKEAAYKALSPIINPKICFIKFCKSFKIKKNINNSPEIEIDLKNMNCHLKMESFISITHTDSMATAIVIFQKKL